MQAKRLDIILTENGWFESREKARHAILSGIVTVNGEVVKKPAKLFSDDCQIAIDDCNKMPYVSLGGLKLKKAIDDFRIDFKGKTVLDVGASTGGFTDCALQHGAEFVWAVDVGSLQLHPILRNNKNVAWFENTDFRDFSTHMMKGSKVDWIVVDVSFISLTHLFPYFPEFLNQDGKIITLIKPQFEAGKAYLNKRGIVKSEKAHLLVLNNITAKAADYGFFLNGLIWAPVFSKSKNIEYLGLFAKQKPSISNPETVISRAFAIWNQTV